jgi:hypothetical protein
MRAAYTAINRISMEMWLFITETKEEKSNRGFLNHIPFFPIAGTDQLLSVTNTPSPAHTIKKYI